MSPKFDKNSATPAQSCANIRRIEVLMARLDERRWSPRPEYRLRDDGTGPTKCSTISVCKKNQISQRLVASLYVALASFMCASPVAFAQTDVNDVHVQAHEVEKPKAPPKENVVSTKDGLTTRVRPLKVDVDLVLVPVTITDPMNRLVTGLEKENFQLFEGSSAQEIRSFSSEDAPVSLGVIFDSSGSMSSKMDRAKEAVVEFFKTANPQDEFFMITFSDEPETVSEFTNSVDEIQNKLIFAIPKHRTALLDAIYMGVSKMRQAKFAKKALLIISDGRDNQSRYTDNA